MHRTAREDLVDAIVIGAHGHARVCLEALQDQTTSTAVRVVGAVSLDGSGAPDLGTTLLGRDAIYVGFKFDEVFNAFEKATPLPILETREIGHPPWLMFWFNATDKTYLVGSVRLWKLEGFKGITKPNDGKTRK
jgi:hypothetical protein